MTTLEVFCSTSRHFLADSNPIHQGPPGEVCFEMQHKTSVPAEEAEKDIGFICSKLISTDFFQQNYAGLKQNRFANRVLVLLNNNMMTFAKLYPFFSSSVVDTIVFDRIGNGRAKWKMKGLKQSYYNLQQAHSAKKETVYE